jgi:hypothetical protein
MTIVDVITGDGTKVTRHALDLSHLSRASSKWDWPNECPCNKDILCWHTGLKHLTSETLSLTFSLRLEHWIQPSHLNWQWFYQQCDRILYHTTNNACHVFPPFPKVYGGFLMCQGPFFITDATSCPGVSYGSI